MIYDAPDISPDGERMVYTTTRHRSAPWSLSAPWRNFEIETSRLNGSGKRRITKDPGQDVAPAWSPDGTRIAFVRHGSNAESPGIYTVAADGSDQQLVVPFRTGSGGEGDLAVYSWGKTGPTWSPDGKKLAYVLGIQERNPDQQRGHKDYTGQVLYTVNVDGSETRELFAVQDSLQESITTEPAWSPDSQRIAFVHAGTVNDGTALEVALYTARADGSQLDVISGPHRELEPLGLPQVLSWSPDGAHILISHPNSENSHFAPPSIINPDGTNLSEVGGHGTQAVWSPDGSKIAQLRHKNPYAPGDPSIFLSTINRDGTDLQVLVRIDEEGNLTAGNPQK